MTTSQLVKTISLSDFGLSSLAVRFLELYVSKGQAELVVDRDRVYLSELNEGDIGLEIKKKTFTPGLVYGQTFEQNMTVIFDRRTGDRIAGIPNPPGVGGLGQQVSLYVDGKVLVQTTPGPFGRGIFIYDRDTLEYSQFRLCWLTRVGRSPTPWE
jgi:hypothetical protein